MDEIEQGILASIPAGALTLRLTRSAIRMQHSHSWVIEKVNSVHDLVICLEGRGDYILGDGSRVTLSPGMAMLIPAGVSFEGRNPDRQTAYAGLAQHFRLDFFGQHDLLARMRLRRVVRLSRWDMVGPLVRHYRATAPSSSTTLMQHHAFMVILSEYIDDAFEGWQSADAPGGEGEALSVAVTLAATRISAEPLSPSIADDVVRDAPYNPDYFIRAFRDRIGSTPKKFHEFKRMERAMQILEGGASVAQTAHEVGYGDAYYFSRMFKRHIGTSPRGYQDHVKRSRDGHFPRGEEDGAFIYPLKASR
ncbi:MAG: helix-turn-helix domain-containing protein [Paracoccus sp. (in: a-proteobacteria)]|nr:helix-turn-helix domain-containing protein [Paracoccus sp. (in: a-proteobacteria)]